MAILARLLEGVNIADVGALLTLVWLVVRLEWTRAENTTAHDAITKNIEGVRRELNGNIEGVRRELNGNIEGVRRELNGNIDGVKQQLNGLKQDVKKLLTGDVAWMQAVLQDRQRRQ